MNTNFKLKTPIIDINDESKKKINLSNLYQIDHKQITTITSNENAKIVGSFAIIFYLLAFFWIYGSSWFKNEITLSLKDKKGFTMSEAFEHSEKVGATTFLVLMSAFITGLEIEQGFIENSKSVAYSDLRYSLVMISFILLASFLLLFWIPISKTNTTQMSFHGLVSIFILFFGVFSSYVFYTSYKEFLKDEPIVDTIEYLTYTLIGLVFVIIISLFVSFMKPSTETIASAFVAGAEIIYIVVYGVILCLFIQLPSIAALNFEKLCFSEK